MEFSRILRLVESSRFLRCRVYISRSFILVEFGRILGLVELSVFFRYGVDISGNLRLVDLGGFPRF